MPTIVLVILAKKISDKLKGMLLLESADLPYLQHNLVLSSVNFTDKTAKDIYDKVKESIRKYHASDEIHKKSSVMPRTRFRP